MSQIANPYGFSHIEKIGGKPRSHTFQFTLPANYGTSIASGDPVSLQGGGGLVIGVPATDANTLPALGTAVSFQYQDITGKEIESLLWVANTPCYPGTAPVVLVDIDPGSIYQVQCNAAIAGATAITPPIGKNYNFGIGAPNTTTTSSTSYLNTATGGGNDVWRNCKIVGLADIPNNAWADPYPDVLVIYNSSVLKPGTLGTN